MNTVAAIPDQLYRYATAITGENERLQIEARALNQALDRFSSRCREYSVPAISGLSAALFAHCRAIGELATWARSIADRFATADSGMLSGRNYAQMLIAMRAGLANHQVARHYPGWLRFDLGARLAWRLIWEVRAPRLTWSLISLSRQIAARLAANWLSRIVLPFSRNRMSAIWPFIRSMLEAHRQWPTQIGLTAIIPWLPWQTMLMPIGNQLWRDRVLVRLQAMATSIASPLINVSWMARFTPTLFGPLSGFVAAPSFLSAPTGIPHTLLQQIVDRCVALGSRGASAIWHYYQQRLLLQSLPWLLLLPNREQSWQLLHQSILLSGNIATRQPSLSTNLLTWFLTGAQIGGVVGLVSGPRLKELTADPANVLATLESGLWFDSFRHLSLDDMREHAIRLEQLNRSARTALFLGPLTRPTTGPDAEPDGQATAIAVFPPLERQVNPGQPYRITPAALQANAHGLISPYFGEEVRAARVGEKEYAVGISGLNLDNMAYGTNGVVSVIETARGVERIEHNAYYQTVRERVLRVIDQLPPGSLLHLTGHSMGGGMCILLSNDPQIQQALSQGNIRLVSVTTLGAVRPQGEWDDVPQMINHQPVIARHYVDSDDALSKAVGAGHDNERYRLTVYEINNNRVDQPTIAHSAYESFDYSQFPEAAQTMPFMIDPNHFELLRVPTGTELTPVDLEWFQEPPLFA
ncbi:hypothetical protein [Chloroflexus sp.]|uniref:hypothetical protein n=1 Tax=Chloroflexus sp. TaxID=1904827 RepID=UPI0026081DBC|nr:hypothetical protein [uncultured Chloroflexus sp.]